MPATTIQLINATTASPPSMVGMPPAKKRAARPGSGLPSTTNAAASSSNASAVAGSVRGIMPRQPPPRPLVMA